MCITSEVMQCQQAMCTIPCVSSKDSTVRPLKQIFNITVHRYRNVDLSSSNSRNFGSFGKKIVPKGHIPLSDF